MSRARAHRAFRPGAREEHAVDAIGTDIGTDWVHSSPSHAVITVVISSARAAGSHIARFHALRQFLR